MFLEVVGNHVGRHNLALSEDDFFLERGEEHLCERAKVVEFLLEEGFCLLAPFISSVQLVDVRHVGLFQTVDDVISPFRVLFVEIIGNLHKGVGGAAHG